jgi:two-component system OmpR family response regulator
MEILVVEDELRVRKFLEDALRSEGHTIFSCTSVDEVESWLALQEYTPDLAILDRMLGDRDGITLIRPIKQRHPDCKILILSAIGIAEDKAQALDLGADDYLSKPFSLAELSARLRALQRRNQSSANPTSIVLSNLTVDLKTQLARTETTKLDLSKKEFQVLITLATHPTRVFTKYQLLDRVWDQQADIESNIVEVTIKNLRRKLEAAKSKAVILSKRNVGYWIEA